MANSTLHNRIHGLTPKHGCSPEDVVLIFLSLQPSWGRSILPRLEYTPSLIPAPTRADRGPDACYKCHWQLASTSPVLVARQRDIDADDGAVCWAILSSPDGSVNSGG